MLARASTAVLFGVFALILGAGAMAPVGAIECSAGLASSIQNSTCTIADKTFQFGPFIANITFPIVTANDILFAPDTSNPDHPGFILSPVAGVNFTVTAPQSPLLVGFAQYFVFATDFLTDPSANLAIIGTTVTQTGAAGNVTGDVNDVRALAVSNLLTNIPSCKLAASAGVSILSNVVTTDRASQTLIFDPACHSLLALTGLLADALIDVHAFSGTATITSAGFYIDETSVDSQPVPEPGTLALLSGAIAATALLTSKHGKWITARRREKAARP
jgi:hypothetical protein